MTSTPPIPHQFSGEEIPWEMGQIDMVIIDPLLRRLGLDHSAESPHHQIHTGIRGEENGGYPPSGHIPTTTPLGVWGVVRMGSGESGNFPHHQNCGGETIHPLQAGRAC